MGKNKKQEDHTPKKGIQRYELNKIIYFDKETIKNILQEYNKGTKQTIVNSNDSSTMGVGSKIEAEADIKLTLPFLSRLRFLFSSKISAEYISRIDETVTVTSTEISDFEKIRDGFSEFEDVTISDIENSATFFRVAGNYMRILKGGIKDVDTKEFKSVMDGYEGYDHYKINDTTYIRFNTSAFLSNYKRNDLLNSRLRIYCIFIGKFPKSNFNFIDRIGKKENYIGYIAMRPRVEKSGTHGLFSYSDEPIKLSKVAKEVGNHDGVMWTTIISLKREDAAKLGYDNLSTWKTLLRAKSQDLANAMGVPITDMKWYAAFHNESGHPHVHLVSYSTSKEPYMTRQGLEKLKAAYAHEIFKNDLYEIYEKQTEYRDELRAESKEKIAEIIRDINGKKYENETLELMLKTLSEKLQKHKGKEVYGYLPKDVKNLVNGVIGELMRDSDLQKLYELWYKQRENVLKTYRDKMPERLPLSANEEFKSVKNAVIAEALNLSFSETPTVDETPSEPTEKEIEKSEKKSRKDYKTAWQFYDWAKACMDKDGENYNPEFAVKLFTEAANGGITVAKYKLGKMFLNGDGVEKDIPKAVEWLKQAAVEENEFAEYALGRLYLQGNEIEKDAFTAEKYLLKAAGRGNKYAAYLLGKEYLSGENFGKNAQKVVEYLKLATEKDFEPAEYVLGKLYLKGEEIGKDAANAEKYLLKAAEHGNKFAEYILGKEYLCGENFSKDVQKAIDYLKRAAEKGFDFAEYELGKIYLFGNDIPKDTETALEYLKSAAANGNEYAQALLLQRELFQKQSINLAIGRLFAYLVKTLQEKTEAELDVKIARTDRKLRCRIVEKKQAQGLKLE